jgi:hypothetical protein
MPIDRVPPNVARAVALAFIGLNTCALIVLSIVPYAAPTAAARVVAMAVPTAMVTPMAPVTTTAAATPIPFARPDLQAGVVFPRWGTSVYGPDDTDWVTGVFDIQQQTGARWIEMVVNFYQNGYSSTSVFAGPGTPTPDDLAAGITVAREAGLQVFVVPFLTVLDVSDGWGAHVHFDDPHQAAAWFDSYWRVFEPYAAAAARAGAADLSIGHEYGGRETTPPGLWTTFIQRAHAVFPGPLTFDVNWDDLPDEPRSWMRDPFLAYLGVSEYLPLVSRPMSLTPAQLANVWQQKLLPQLDALSAAAHKPILLAEIGYRNTTDALYRPWVHSTNAPPDPQLQAAAYAAATRAAFGDPHIMGIYFYAWGNGQFQPSAQAAAVLRTLYLSPAA